MLANCDASNIITDVSFLKALWEKCAGRFLAAGQKVQSYPGLKGDVSLHVNGSYLPKVLGLLQ